MPTSAGTKVTPSDAPVYLEGAGIVTKDSLAAENIQAGGKFATNRNIREPTPPSNDSASQKPHETPREAATTHHSGQGAPAPTYINNIYNRYPGGPHGKDIKEDPEMTGRPAKFNVQPGSKDDPAREAEKRFIARKQVGGAPGGGNGPTEQPFEALGRETDA